MNNQTATHKHCPEVVVEFRRRKDFLGAPEVLVKFYDESTTTMSEKQFAESFNEVEGAR